ncbi:hypothetical protein C2G38_2167433 [Gigaspora rosea]|uniref:Uncharacterized protein n=1 Tax=Gigaspora rosea TaxID=44941 RepID=A0A397VXX8_9GLOM|nr:hypothetical protein C2G38_2167433 [Gigaspora rosea]
MAFFKKFVNKFNKKESLNIECQSENFEATNKKEIINEFEVQEENCWPVIEQNFESNGWNNIKQEPASSNWMNKKPSSSTNTDETFFYKKTPSVSIEQENPSFIKKNGRVVENMILDLIAGQLKIDEIETIKVQEENCWPVIEQNFESNGWNNIKQEPASSNWMNKKPSSSTNTDETFFYKKTPSVSIEQENPSFIKKNGRVVENMILDLIAGQLKIDEIETIKVCLVDGNFFTLDNQDSNLLWKLEGSKIIIQNTNFSSIIVSEYARNNMVIDKDGFWEYRQ